jgi:hypothetical protein
MPRIRVPVWGLVFFLGVANVSSNVFTTVNFQSQPQEVLSGKENVSFLHFFMCHSSHGSAVFCGMGQRFSLPRQFVFIAILSLLLLDTCKITGFMHSFRQIQAIKRIKTSVMALSLGGHSPPLV